MSKTPKDHTPIEVVVDESIFRAIGSLIVRASAADLTLAAQILRLIGTSEVALHAYPVVAGMEFKVKLGVVRMMAAILNPVEAKSISVICDKLQDGYQRRNEIAHALLAGPGRTPKEGVFMILKPDAKRRDLQAPKPLTADQIMGWALDMTDWSNKLNERLTELGYPTARPWAVGQEAPQPASQTEAAQNRSAQTEKARPRRKPRGQR